MKNQFTSSVLHEGFIYGLDESILACVDAATGELKWKGGRYGYGQVILASGHLIVLTEQGDLVLVRATPGSTSGARALPGARGQDLEPPGDERRVSCSCATSTRWRRSICGLPHGERHAFTRRHHRMVRLEAGRHGSTTVRLKP